MFTGIVTDVGEIAEIEKIKDTRAKFSALTMYLK